VKGAQDDVVRHPNERKPSRPVAGSKHIYSADNSQESDEANQDQVILNGTLLSELGGMVGQPDNTDRQKYAADHGD
jgi:hypothetical protein